MNKNKIYFASDFHLGIPNLKESHDREKHIVRWLTLIEQDAKTIYLLGDIFDFGSRLGLFQKDLSDYLEN